MPQYKYIAQNAEGKRVRGTMQAANETELHSSLRQGDLMLISAKLNSDQQERKALKPRQLSEFCRQLGTLLGAGVTLVRALNIIAQGESIRPKERQIYEEILMKLRQGIPFSEAMEEMNGAFPLLMIHMFRSAESSGNLDRVAMKLAAQYDKEHKLKAKVSSALTYPKILMVMIIGVILILTQFVMPQLQDLFTQMENLPASTRLLMKISDVIRYGWYWILAAGLGLWVLFRLLMTRAKFRQWWHRVQIHVPVIGNLQKIVCTARFAQTLSSLYAAGIPIVSALQTARNTVGNDYIAKQFDQVIPYVRAGNNLSDALERVDGFSRKLTDAIRVGEETGSLDTMLLSTSESMEYDADIAVTKMVSYVEPLMLILMALVVGFVIAAVFSAIYGSYGAIANLA